MYITTLKKLQVLKNDFLNCIQFHNTFYLLQCFEGAGQFNWNIFPFAIATKRANYIRAEPN